MTASRLMSVLDVMAISRNSPRWLFYTLYQD